jgi:hypothetical protein
MSSKLDINPASGKGNMEVNPSSDKGVLLLQGTTIELPFFTFTTNASTRTFDPGFGAPFGDLVWDLGDGSIVTGNVIDHEYSQAGDKEVKVYLGTVSNVEGITSVSVYQDDIKGSLDFSEFTEISTILANDNPLLTEVIVPPSDKNFSFQGGTCDLTGTLDLSELTNLQVVTVSSNPNLTSVLFPPSSSNAVQVNVFNCNITGPIDVSGLNLAGQFTMAANAEMTQLLLPLENTGSVTSFYLYGNSKCYGDAGVFDFSQWTNMSGQIHIGSIDASVIKLPTSSGTFSGLTLYGTDISILDMSGITFSSNGLALSIQNSPNLAQLVFPVDDVSVASLNMSNSGFSGILDLSSVQLKSFLYAYGNELTGIIHKSSSNPLEYRAQSNQLTGTLDVSGLTGLGTRLFLSGNSDLSEILLPDFSYEWADFDVTDCSLNQSTIDNIFSKMNTYYSSNTPTQSLIIDANGGTNMPPTDGSSNSDILNLENIFSVAGESLIININT